VSLGHFAKCQNVTCDVISEYEMFYKDIFIHETYDHNPDIWVLGGGGRSKWIFFVWEGGGGMGKRDLDPKEF
jgi:hypothetical protein